MNTIQEHPQNNISWSDVYFTAESEKEPFTDLTIFTAKSEMLMIAASQAVQTLLSQQKQLSDTIIDELSQQLIEENKIQVYEFARIGDDKTEVCIDVDIIDDDTVWKALDMVYKAVSSGGTWIADTPISYTWDELKTNNTL